MATTKKPKSSTAAASKTRTGTARPAAKKAAVKKPAAKPVAAKKPAAKAAPARKPVATTESTTIRDSAPRRTAAQGWAVKGPAAKGTAAKAAPGKAAPGKATAAKKSPAKASLAKGASAGRAAIKGTPVATPPQPKPRKGGKKPAVPTDIVERLRLEVRRALEELKAKDVVELDVRGRTSIADFIVVASGTSTRHVKSVADEVVRYAKQAGMIPLGVEGQREAEWVLVDLGDIIVHIMLPRVREFYGLERLWAVGGEQAEAAYA